ncbi:MAG: hypothetical protein MUC96_21295 [Myxococcaceae bacterium]|jgi:hypothetical protein|nr:hypothetical protein [Myxococcaceae bacterium]
MTTTRIGTPFQNILSKVKDARVVSEKTGAPNGILGTPTTREYDLDGNGTVDARSTEWAHRRNGTRTVLSFLDGQGRAVDTFVSGGKSGWTMKPGEPAQVWSHTHTEYGSGANKRVVHERANSGTGELGFRASTTLDGKTERAVYESDRDGNGTLETVVRN